MAVLEDWRLYVIAVAQWVESFFHLFLGKGSDSF